MAQAWNWLVFAIGILSQTQWLYVVAAMTLALVVIFIAVLVDSRD